MKSSVYKQKGVGGYIFLYVAIYSRAERFFGKVVWLENFINSQGVLDFFVEWGGNKLLHKNILS